MTAAERINSWLDQGVLKAKLEKDGSFFCFRISNGSIDRERFASDGRYIMGGSVERGDLNEMKAEIEDLKKQGWKPHYGRVKETEGV
ncbi:MAG: hypothetical protein GY814_16845 [Gammaproteobacteria bacterium]|nr:hypothetical protein [Gammaproteobacteria bacterium]